GGRHRRGDRLAPVAEETPMAVALIRELYDYHNWANRRLFDLAAGLGDGATRDMGAHWSFPTLKGTFAHVYGADHSWLKRWQGSSPSRLMGGGDLPSMGRPPQEEGEFGAE